MEFLKFLKWWWMKMPSSSRFGISFFTFIISWIASICVFGPIAVLFVMGMIILAVILFLFYKAFDLIHTQWLEYKIEKDAEGQRIINRLSGKPDRIEPYLDTNLGSGVTSILAKIRARSKKTP